MVGFLFSGPRPRRRQGKALGRVTDGRPKRSALARPTRRRRWVLSLSGVVAGHGFKIWIDPRWRAARGVKLATRQPWRHCLGARKIEAIGLSPRAKIHFCDQTPPSSEKQIYKVNQASPAGGCLMVSSAETAQGREPPAPVAGGGPRAVGGRRTAAPPESRAREDRGTPARSGGCATRPTSKWWGRQPRWQAPLWLHHGGASGASRAPRAAGAPPAGPGIGRANA